jgi:four helix bundle protein
LHDHPELVFPLLNAEPLMSCAPAPVRSYRDLKVWESAMQLATECISVAGALARQRRYSLADQIERAAISVPSNLAEGNGRRGRADYLRHLSIANGSLFELETQLALVERAGLLEPAALERAHSLVHDVGCLLNGLIRKLRTSESPS